MPKWGRWVILAAVAGGVFYVGYDAYRAGYHTRPDMPEGAFSISYKNGLRAILIGMPNEQATRRYFGFPFDVPFYLEEAWSFCSAPTSKDIQQGASFMKSRNWPGERFEAVCRLNVDNDVVARGMVTSVPKL